MSANQSQLTFPVLCIPRAMLFHTAEIVENAFNLAMGGKFIKEVHQSTTTDSYGKQFKVMILHPEQDFKANINTDKLYRDIKNNGVANISTGGDGKYFWKTKLYIPHMKAQYLPPKTEAVAEVPVPVGQRVMSESDLAEFRIWQAEKRAAWKASEDARLAKERARIEEERKAAEAERLRNELGERLYPLVVELLSREFPSFKHPGKITGMLLEMDVADIQRTITDKTELETNVREGVRVLRESILQQAGFA